MSDKTLGAYERHESPDYADGGVAAALIEKEAEEPNAEVRELRSALAREVARGNALQDTLDATPAAMTARELLDAAWEAAHVPADGMIPAGAEYVARKREREVRGPFTTGATIPDTDPSGVLRRRLLDPPAPARPEGAEKIEAYMRELVASHPEDHYGELADHLASRGVRAPENGDPQ